MVGLLGRATGFQKYCHGNTGFQTWGGHRISDLARILKTIKWSPQLLQTRGVRKPASSNSWHWGFLLWVRVLERSHRCFRKVIYEYTPSQFYFLSASPFPSVLSTVLSKSTHAFSQIYSRSEFGVSAVNERSHQGLKVRRTQPLPSDLPETQGPGGFR